MKKVEAYGILVGGIFWLHGLREETCVLDRDSLGILEFTSTDEAKDFIKNKPALQGATIVEKLDGKFTA
jgi:hypothetical protein